MNLITAFALFLSSRASDDPEAELPTWITVCLYVNMSFMCVFVLHELYPMIELFRETWHVLSSFLWLQSLSLLHTGVNAGGFVYERYSNESGNGSEKYSNESGNGSENIFVVKEKRPMTKSTQGRKRSGKGRGKSSQMPYSRKGATPSASKSTRPAVLWYRSHAQA